MAEENHSISNWGKMKQSHIVDTDDIPWAPFVLEGTFFKLLRMDFFTGQHVFLLKIPAGLSTGLHKHLASVEVLVLEGEFTYPGEGTMKKGSYVLEPGGCVHEPVASESEDLVMLVFAQGPIMGVGENGEPLGVVDMDAIWQAAGNAGIAKYAHRTG